MDYQRTRRNINYHSNSCKMYLRHDFRHRCAYCGLPEAAMSPIQLIAESFFEKDHFMPQNPAGDKDDDVHRYSNLFYACKKCNHIKDNVLLPLNPCEDDIFGGISPSILNGDPAHLYLLHPTTAEGEDYIDKLQLNCRMRVELREKTIEYLEKKKEQQKIIAKLETEKLLTEDLIVQLKDSLDISEDPLREMCGSSTYANNFIDACKYLSLCGYSYEVLLDEQEIDLKVSINCVDFYGQLRIGPKHQSCRLKKEMLLQWRELHEHCGIFEYIPIQSKIDFFKIDFDSLDWDKATIQLNDFTTLC